MEEFNYIVMNNGQTDELKMQISDLCKKYNIYEIPFDNPSVQPLSSNNHITAIKHLYQNYINKDSLNTKVVMDSDIFAFKGFSFYNILEGYDVIGLSMIDYFSAIFTMYSSNIDLSNFEIDGQSCDTGSGTGSLILKHKTKGILHTGVINQKEAEYIFKDFDCNPSEFARWSFHFISDCFVHYYKGSGWAIDDEEYHQKKFSFLLNFLDNSDSYNLNLDDKVWYELALCEQFFRPQLYKFLN